MHRLKSNAYPPPAASPINSGALLPSEGEVLDLEITSPFLLRFLGAATVWNYHTFIHSLPFAATISPKHPTPLQGLCATAAIAKSVADCYPVTSVFHLRTKVIRRPHPEILRNSESRESSHLEYIPQIARTWDVPMCFLHLFPCHTHVVLDGALTISVNRLAAHTQL
ncbi:hypothetical protein L218DRAFT_447181 [Marasmius fiardii PR-910]|nr:hypothetical protein L218DRAFT_447181 [Marasmius fiardii PR-910]